MLRSEINIRDPYVALLDGKYYLYGTTGANCWDGAAEGFDAYVSDDLEHFDGPLRTDCGGDTPRQLDFMIPEVDREFSICS